MWEVNYICTWITHALSLATDSKMAETPIQHCQTFYPTAKSMLLTSPKLSLLILLVVKTSLLAQNDVVTFINY